VTEHLSALPRWPLRARWPPAQNPGR